MTIVVQSGSLRNRNISLSPARADLTLSTTVPLLDDIWSTLDGRASAPSGTAPYPTLLDTYHPAGPSDGRYRTGLSVAASRSASIYQPPWMVAGVDYNVGLDPAVTLTTPSISGGTLNGISGTTFDGSKVEVTGNDVTISNFDFTGIDIGGQSGTSNVTFLNCNFSCNAQQVSVGLTTDGATFRYCLFQQDGFTYPGNTPTPNAMLDYFGNGRITIEYCWFKIGWDVVVQITGGAHATSQACTFQYNVVENAGYGHQFDTNFHGDWIQFFGDPVITDIQLHYNTLIQDIVGADSQGWSITFSGQEYDGGAINHNTYVLNTSSSGVTYVNIFTTGASYPSPFEIKENYIDLTGAIFGFTTPGSGSSSNPHTGSMFTSDTNVNLQTGGIVLDEDHG